MKSTVIVLFLKIRKGNTSICVNSYNKLHILPAKLKNKEFHSERKYPDNFSMFTVHLLCGSAFRYLLPHHYFLCMPIFAPVQLSGFQLTRNTV